MTANRMTRWTLWSALLLAPAASAGAAPMHHEFDRLAAPIKGMLMQASDKALDRLARPGAFSTDDAIRIILPGQPDEVSALMGMADKAGMTARLQLAINDAAGMAAGQAKPIFRRAIQRMTLRDTIRILSKDHGATNYLAKTSGDELYAMLRPIIANALDRTGAYKLAKLKASGALARLAHPQGPATQTMSPPSSDGDDDPMWDPEGAAAPISREDLADDVTNQAMRGIFKYIAHQEEKIRRDPSDLAFKLLDRMDR